MNDLENLLPEFIAWRREGQPVALVTLVQSSGSSPRPLGSQMVVANDGRSAGYLTGGCAEHVIVAEALDAFSAGANRTIRLGSGSPYLDIQLPCGAGITLYIDIGLDDSTASQLASSLAARQAIALDTVIETGAHQCVGHASTPLATGSFRRWFLPRRQLLVIGKGPNVGALADLAHCSGYQVRVMSPDAATLNACNPNITDRTTLTTPDAFRCPAVDCWTAAVLLFHEHDWEPGLLSALLPSSCFYVGALGSHRTHARRLQRLNDRGLGSIASRLHGPVGLDIQAQTPPEIGLSILAEITAVHRKQQRRLIQYDIDSSTAIAHPVMQCLA